MDYEFLLSGEDFELNDFNASDVSINSNPLIMEEGAVGGVEETTLGEELVNTGVDDFYDHYGSEKPLFRRYGHFMVDEKGILRLKTHPNVDLISPKTRRPLALSTLKAKYGISFVRDTLNFVDFNSKRPPQEFTAKKVQEISQIRENVIEITDSLTGGESPAILTNKATLAGRAIEETLSTLNDPPAKFEEIPRNLQNNIRELMGLDKMLQTIRGNLVLESSRLSEIDTHLKLEKRKLTETNDPDDHSAISKRIQELSSEKAHRSEVVSSFREKLRAQTNRIRETIDQIINRDTTLKERIKTLFREQGITIASIVTAIGFIISTITLSISGLSGGGSGGGGTPPSGGGATQEGGGGKEWLKKRLEELGRGLGNLAGVAVNSLPGIIGSIVSWLLNFLSKTATFVSHNLWAVVVGIGGLLFIAAKEWITHQSK